VAEVSRALAAGRTWVVDPLDGTVNYANGIPYFCVSIALVEDGRPVLGAVCDPMRGETWWATANGPAWLGDREIHASRKEALTDFVISLALGGRAVATRGRAVRKAIRASRNTGSAALALAYVANGRFDAFLQSGGMSAWDVAAAGLIAERAGAVVTDATGGPWFDVEGATRRFGIVAAPALHHATLLGLSRA
jgi:myo-inositol-1(or 4)-monophosphatase